MKYLGVLLDCNLSGSCHVFSLFKSCMGRLSFLHRNSSYLNFQSRKMLCMTLIQPYVDYCSSAWYEDLSVLLKAKLDILQRKMLRFIFEFDNRHHVGLKDLESLSWLSVPDRMKFFKLVHMFKIKHGLAPQYLRFDLSSVSDTHTHNTHGSTSNFHVSKSLSQMPSSFAFSSVKYWNSLPAGLKGINSLSTFKRELRRFFLSSYG